MRSLYTASPIGARPDPHPVRRELWRKRIDHQRVARTVVKAESLPAAARHRNHWTLIRSEIQPQRKFLGMPVGMEDIVINRPTFDQNVSIVRREPVQVIDRPLPRQEIIILTLHGERAALDRHGLGRPSYDAQIAGFLREDLQFQFPNQIVCSVR